MMFFKSPRILSSTFVLALVSIAAGAQFTVTLEIRPGTDITGDSFIPIEAFVRNDGLDIGLLGAQIDIPCILTGLPGAVGELRTQPIGECATSADCPGVACYTPPNPNVCFSVSVSETGSSAASGSVPWLFGIYPPNDHLLGGLYPVAQFACRWAGAPNAGEPPYIFPGGGTRRYLGTIRYLVPTCAAGTFVIGYEVLSSPCYITDLNRLVGTQNQCLETEWVPLAITIPVGACCDGTACVADGINRECCYANHGTGAVWREGRSCAELTACDCDTDEECDDTSFCNGQERCDQNHCVRNSPIICPESLFPCAIGVCDPVADRCREQLRPYNYPCDVATDCLQPGTCDGASPHCQGTPVPTGTACEDGNPCTAADTCEHSGVCLSGSPVMCDDGLACNGLETCNPATGCIPGQPLCGPAETCDEVTATCHPAVIPTVSHWGLLVVALSLAIGGKLRFRCAGA